MSDRRTDGHMGNQSDTMIPRLYLVMGYEKSPFDYLIMYLKLLPEWQPMQIHIKLLKDLDDDDQGLVVQSVVSLTSSLRVISLTVLADSIHNILIFFC